MKISNFHKGILLTFGVGFITSAFEMVKQKEYYFAIALGSIGIALFVLFAYLIEKQSVSKAVEIFKKGK